MKLPNGHAALVEREKLTDYLLNPSHPDNGGKAPFFLALGFRIGDWEFMAQAFRRLAQTGNVTETLESGHGTKYVLDGPVETPSGRAPVVRSVWIIDHGRTRPRLVTAYPAGSRQERL